METFDKLNAIKYLLANTKKNEVATVTQMLDVIEEIINDDKQIQDNDTIGDCYSQDSDGICFVEYTKESLDNIITQIKSR